MINISKIVGACVLENFGYTKRMLFFLSIFFVSQRRKTSLGELLIFQKFWLFPKFYCTSVRRLFIREWKTFFKGTLSNIIKLSIKKWGEQKGMCGVYHEKFRKFFGRGKNGKLRKILDRRSKI